MTDDPWSCVRPLAETGGTLPARIAAHVEGLIALGRLAPGDRLPSERDLAQMFGVGRLSVREAVRRLEALELVDVRRGAGAFVSPRAAAARVRPSEALLLSPVDVDELLEVRRLLEPAAAEWAALRADRSELAGLQRAAEHFEVFAASLERRVELLAVHDVQLHLEIAQCADNALLGRLVERLQDLHRLQLEWSLRRPGRVEETVAEHRRVVDAIVGGDSQGAREAMLRHVTAAAAAFHDVVAGKTTAID
jgi:GntR family transcriptional regulator, transcriptional repressor for pyruvate dehydrogenase complex